MSGIDKFRAGFGKAFADLGRGAGQLVGVVDRNDVAESRARDSALMKNGTATAGNILGNLAALAPTAMIPGAASIPGAALIGAGTGLIQPSTSNTETALNTGVGALAGAAVPLVQRGWQIGKAAAEPLYRAGQERIVGRTLNLAAGNNAPAVAQRLADASAPFVGPSQGVQRTVMGEFVPGSLPTVGQAAGNAGVAALERAAAATNPAVNNAISDTMHAQNAARVGVLDEMAGRTSGARDFFGAARDATANGMYANARANGLQPLTQPQQALVGDLLQRPAMRDALASATRLAQNEGLNIGDPAGSVAGLDYVRRALADQVGSATGNERRILEGLMTRLTGVMDAISPDLRAARETFAGMSRPLNQMDVAHELMQRSVNPLTGNLQPAAYARSLTDATVARATGFPQSTLEGTMNPAQMNQINSVLLDLQRSNAAQNVGRGVGSDTIQKLAYTNLMDQSGVPTFVQNMRPLQVLGNLAARGGDAVYGRANREIAGLLGDVMLDPQRAAQLMLRATPAERSQVLGLLATGAQGGLLSAPASAYALQH
jgi:hypothetical protein